MSIKAYFEDIHKVIIQHIEEAQEEILIAVAWFTDKDIFQSLRKALIREVAVSIVLMEDSINLRTTGLNFKQLEALGATIKFIPPQGKQGTLMHHKFCIIDNSLVLTGSYNWSKRARSNNENITLIEGNKVLTQQFREVFEELTTDSQQAKSIPSKDIVKRRLELIRNLVMLEELEDVTSHVQKLAPFSDELGIHGILENLNQGNYEKAIEGIQGYLSKLSAIVSMETTEVPRLQFELSILELRLEALSNEKADLERLLIVFNRRHDEVLGDLITQVLKTQAELRRLEAEKMRKEAEDSVDEELKEKAEEAEAQAEEAENAHKKYSENHESLKEEAPLPELDEEEEEELKSLYRRACQVCHPDKVPEAQKDEAHMMFVELQKAYKNNNVKELKKLYKQIKDGNFKTTQSASLSKVELLKTAIAKMNFQIDRITEELKDLNASDGVKRLQKAGQSEEEWRLFFAEEAHKLERMLDDILSSIELYSE